MNADALDRTSWISNFARAGYAAKGLVYGTIGILALLAALGKGGEILGAKAVLQKFGEQPMGSAILVVVGVGLACYGIYRFLCALCDAENVGDDAKGIAKRVGYFGSGAAYLALGITTLTGLAGAGGGGDGGKEQLTARVLAMPFGPWLIGGLGLAIVAAGLFQFVNAAKGSYRSKFNLDGFAATKRKWIDRAAKIGLCARGVVFPIIGGFLISAAVKSDASETMGLGEALAKLSQQSYGAILLGVTAAGFFCYGIYCGVLAIYGNFGRR